ncbi:MAG: 50S ribosomal protein L6 [Thermodesulfobacteriota bacterium]|nr:50S ribosomal protein L6 [Thermodesulfobacteriota bacterium]
MSRIGKKPIPIPKELDIEIEGDLLTVKGPKGELKRRIHSDMRLSIDKEKIEVSTSDETRDSRALHGLFRMLISNMVTGVTKGFERALEIVGVGYRVELKGRTAVFNLGYSHPIDFELPDGIDAKIDKMRITLSGIDKELLGMTSAKIRSLRKPEPYKGKGIRYVGEVVRRKAGKAGAA